MPRLVPGSGCTQSSDEALIGCCFQVQKVAVDVHEYQVSLRAQLVFQTESTRSTDSWGNPQSLGLDPVFVHRILGKTQVGVVCHCRFGRGWNYPMPLSILVHELVVL